MLTRMRAMRECYTIEYEDKDLEDLSPKDCTHVLPVSYTPYRTSWTDPESPIREYKVVTQPARGFCNQIPTLITSSGSLIVMGSTHTHTHNQVV